MKTCKIFLILLLGMHTALISQEISREFGRIGQGEIAFNQYSKDPSADAVVFFDIGKSYFLESNSHSFDVIFERTTRIKILSEAGLKWAEVEIPFYQEGGIYEIVYDVEAYTYNFDNGQLTKTRLENSGFHDEKVNEYWNLKKFAMPDIKPGSIIEYKYKINSQYKFNLRDWEFQWKIPVIYSEYEVKMIPFYEYSWLLQGANKFDSQTSYPEKGIGRQFGPVNFNDMVHKYIMKDVPAFNDEEFISSITDYIIKIDFQLAKVNQIDGGSVNIMTTWPAMVNELVKHDDFGKYIAKSEKLSEKLLDLNSLADKSEFEKFDYIVSYVKANYNWTKVYGKYATKSPNEFVKDKVGNCAEINLFLAGLLKAAGIEVSPVLISTRGNGKILYDYPFSHFFNYVIVMATVDGKDVLTDATEILCSNFRIPAKCINDKGLIVKKNDEVQWVDLSCPFFSTSQTNISIDFQGTDMQARVNVSSTEYDALNYRNTYGQNEKKIKEKLDEKGYEINPSSITVKNHLTVHEPYILNYDLNYEPEVINGKIYFSPFLNEPITENPLIQPTRKYPIDMVYPTRKAFHSMINIPEGYKIDFLPEGSKIENDAFSLEYQVDGGDEKIIVSFVYYFKSSVYSPSDYSKIKYFFNEIIRKGNEKIVLAPE